MGVTPWLEIEDQDDNYLIVSPGTAIADNPNEHYRFDGVSQDEWLGKVITSGPGRVGAWSAQETFLGPDPTTAVGCCIAHAKNGEDGAQSWNASTEGGGNEGPPVCRSLAAGGLLVNPAEQTIFTEVSSGVTGTPGDWEIPWESAGAQAVYVGPAYFCWHLPVRDNLPPRGALDFIPQPEDYGYPPFSEGTEIEWEDTHPGLLGLQVADGDPTDVADYPNVWAVNDGVGPTYGADDAGWRTGSIPAGGAYQYVTWSYDTGATDWQDVPDTVGWDGHGWAEDYDDDPSGADSTVVAQPDTAAENLTASRFARVAFKYTLRASRFRFIYEGVPPVIRQYPRDDGKGISSAPRLYPPTKANRLAGGYM